MWVTKNAKFYGVSTINYLPLTFDLSKPENNSLVLDKLHVITITCVSDIAVMYIVYDRRCFLHGDCLSNDVTEMLIGRTLLPFKSVGISLSELLGLKYFIRRSSSFISAVLFTFLATQHSQ